MNVTLTQLAWYIERDGARLAGVRNGVHRYEVPHIAGVLVVEVPPFLVDELNAERDKVYKVLRDRERRSRG